jgi:hypothetical protein
MNTINFNPQDIHSRGVTYKGRIKSSTYSSLTPEPASLWFKEVRAGKYSLGLNLGRCVQLSSDRGLHITEFIESVVECMFSHQVNAG